MTPVRKQKLETVLARRQSNLTIVLENVSDPHNISAVMRTCDAVGVQEIFILNSRIDLHTKWGAKSSSSAAKWLTVNQFTDAAQCFSVVRERFSKIYSTHLTGESKALHQLDLTESVALIFGNEHSGVSEDILRYADGNFMIPQVGIIQSLNISVACAVTLYEAYRQKELAGHYLKPSLSRIEMSQIQAQWGFQDDIEEL